MSTAAAIPNYKRTPFYRFVAANFTADQLRSIGITELHLANNALLTDPEPSQEDKATCVIDGGMVYPPGHAVTDEGSRSSLPQAPEKCEAGCVKCLRMEEHIRRLEEQMGPELSPKRLDTPANLHSSFGSPTHHCMEFEIAAEVVKMWTWDGFASLFCTSYNCTSRGRPIRAEILNTRGGGQPMHLRVYCQPDQELSVHCALIDDCHSAHKLSNRAEASKRAKPGGLVAAWREEGLVKKADLSDAIDAAVPSDMEALSGRVSASLKEDYIPVTFEELNPSQKECVEWMKARVEEVGE